MSTCDLGVLDVVEGHRLKCQLVNCQSHKKVTTVKKTN